MGATRRGRGGVTGSSWRTLVSSLCGGFFPESRPQRIQVNFAVPLEVITKTHLYSSELLTSWHPPHPHTYPPQVVPGGCSALGPVMS